MKRILLLLLLLLLAFALPAVAQVDVTLVNMIPSSLSNETERDAELSLAVDPANPRRMAASAFTPDPMMSGVAPIFVSTNGGASWELRPLVPDGNVTWDVSLRFGGLSGILYAGGIPESVSRTYVMRKPDFTSTAPPTILRSTLRDQPWVEATTAVSATSPDRVYITAGDGIVEQSLDAATAPPPAGIVGVDVSPTTVGCVGNAPSVRPAIHSSGRIYVTYMRWTSDCREETTIGDVIVVRDDHWGASTPAYAALTTGGVLGVSAATSRPFPYFDYLGGQRVGSQIAIAVDPNDRDLVFVVWGDGPTGAEQSLRMRRSRDGGRTWSDDLRVIPNATNPAVAVNTHGVVGFMYQRYIAATDRWETHFEWSRDGFATAPFDVLLANVPNTNPLGNHLGDYANMMSVGKDFYGAFAASNVAERTNFPHDVTYLRNVNWTTRRLRNLTNTADVAPSIDPFFFRIRMLPPSHDFYVRDWNDGATGDDGREPSSHPVFFETSDVWNRRGTDPGTFGPNDPPPNEDAGNGAGRAGDNWAMARIRRNAPGTAPATVNAHFLVSEFGTGSAYSDATTANPNLTFGPDVTVTFDPAETGPRTTPPMQWHLGAVMSPHLCLAVEIASPDDPYIGPSLAGQWPGWSSGTDLRVLADNNRAQRNMGLTTIPAREMGAMMDERMAVIHNGATFTRDMEVVYDVEGQLRPRLRVDGQPVDDTGAILLEDMLPGENRWLTVALPAEMEVRFAERFAGVPVNGFTVAARAGAIEDVIREKLELHRSVFTRLAAMKVPGAAAEAEMARNGEKDYVGLLQKRVTKFAKMLPDVGALDALQAALKSGDPARVAVAHSVLLHRVDAALTRQRLAAGDPADVVLNVRWQRDLFLDEEKLPCAAKLLAASQTYLDAIGQRKITNAEYPSLLKESASCLAAAGASKDAMASLLNATSLAAQQKAHRDVLLSLQGVRTR